MTSLFQPSFAAGELSPGLRYRSDLGKWRAGASKISNMIVHFSGGVSNRGGTQFVGYARIATPSIWLIPFEFSTDQTYVLEFTAGIIRIVTQGAFVEVLGVPLEIVTPYTADVLPDLKYVQSNDILTITHPAHPPYELRRYSVTSWTMTAINFGTALLAPTSLAGTPSGGVPGGTPTPSLRDYFYSVSTVGTAPPDESDIAASITVNNYDLGYNAQTGVMNTLTWDAATGASYYNVYRNYLGVWAFIGSTSETTFVDTNTLPDTATTPPIAEDPFLSGNYPVSVGFHQQRRVFGGTVLTPLALYFSRTANYNRMDSSQPTRPDDAIVASLVARQNNAIRHLIPMQDLVVLTASAAWSVAGNNGVITPADVVVKPQAYVGASQVQPVTINTDIVYSREKGGGITALAYEWQANSFGAKDLSVLASHLFTGRTVLQMAWAESPHRILWCLMDDGTMAGFTYMKEQDVYAWHTHETTGFIRSICTVSEGGHDVLYLAVQRGLGGVVQTCIERMMPRDVNDPAYEITEAWFVDCGLQYDGVPATTISGLDHLTGNAVAILADGNVLPAQTVVAGAITLEQAASVVTVGLPFTAELRTLPLDGPPGQSVLGSRKHVTQYRVFMENTRGCTAALIEPGQTPNYVPFKERTFEPWGTPPTLSTGTREFLLPGGWSADAVISVRQADPLPVTILAVMPDVTVGEYG